MTGNSFMGVAWHPSSDMILEISKAIAAICAKGMAYSLWESWCPVVLSLMHEVGIS